VTEQLETIANAATNVASSFFSAAGQLTRIGQTWMGYCEALDSGDPTRICEAAQAIVPFDFGKHLETIAALNIAGTQMGQALGEAAIESWEQALAAAAAELEGETP
jgi:hypothetical protein